MFLSPEANFWQHSAFVKGRNLWKLKRENFSELSRMYWWALALKMMEKPGARRRARPAAPGGLQPSLQAGERLWRYRCYSSSQAPSPPRRAPRWAATRPARTERFPFLPNPGGRGVCAMSLRQHTRNGDPPHAACWSVHLFTRPLIYSGIAERSCVLGAWNAHRHTKKTQRATRCCKMLWQFTNNALKSWSSLPLKWFVFMDQPIWIKLLLLDWSHSWVKHADSPAGLRICQIPQPQERIPDSERLRTHRRTHAHPACWFCFSREL